MEQVGFVRKVNGNNVEVEVRRVSACGDNCKSCGGSCSAPNHVVILSNNVNAKAGDFVEIKGEAKNILKYTMIIYMVPVTMLIIGILIGMKILKNLNIISYEPFSFLIGLVFMAIGYFIVKIIDKRFGKRNKDIIQMTRII